MADDGLTDEDRERIAVQHERLAILKRRIDDELRVSRPDRYDSSHEFLNEVAERIAHEVPATLAQEMLARSLVGQREGQATKRVNKFLRGLWGADGQYALPVDWYCYVDEPVAITVPVLDGESNVVAYTQERVTLRAVSKTDWKNFVTAGRNNAQQRYDAELRMYDAADWCSRQQGTADFSTWAETLVPRPVSSVS